MSASKGPINVAIVGTGMSLKVFHRPIIVHLTQKFRLHTVVERGDKGIAKSVCGEDVKVVKTLEEALGDKEVELVVISTPNNTHFPYAKAALEAGKHVLIEKPMCVTSEQGKTLADLAKQRGLICSVFQNRRWDSDFLTVQKVIQEGKLGEIVDFTSNYDRYRPLPPNRPSTSTWKETPGEHNDVIYNLGSHIIDQIYVLFGMPEKVGCRFSDVRGVGVDEGFYMTMHYPPTPGTASSPMIATVQGSILSCLPAQQRFLIRGTIGSFQKFGVDPQESHLKKLDTTTAEYITFGVETPDQYGVLFEARAAGPGEEGSKNNDGTEFVTSKYESVKGDYNALYENLYDAIRVDPSKLIVKPEQAIDVLRIIEMGQKAAKEERLVSANE